MDYAELSAAQHRRSKEFAEAQTDAMAVYCEAEHDLKNLQDENAKLRELVVRMAHVLSADDEWQDPFYCNPYCADQFRCRSDDCVEVLCPIVEAMRKLGMEVDE